MRGIRVTGMLAALLLMAQPAFAHGFMQNAEPAAGAALTKSPDKIVLHYSSRIREGSIVLTGASGKAVAGVGVVEASGNTLSATVPKLLPGTYRVRWQAVSIDSHETHGTYPFRVMR